MRIADGIIKLLEKNEVEYIYGIPASTFGGILDAINDSHIKYIIPKNEAGATYSASKYAEISNKIGVCMLAGGVGLNNAINGIAEAQRNKLPMLIISGDVSRSFMGKGALQEFDNAEIVKSITKYSKNITKEEEVFIELQKAIDISMTPPCGPVLISIPYDLQLSLFNGDPNVQSVISKHEYDDKALATAIVEINKKDRGLIFIGRGTRGLGTEIKELSKKLDWPIISTPNAKGVINSDFSHYIGNYGFCSADGAIEYVENEQIDCVLILGTSLGQGSTRNFNEVLIKGRKVIRIDWDTKEFDKVFKEDISVCFDLKKAIRIIADKVTQRENTFLKPKMNQDYVKKHTGISLRLLYERVPEILPKDSRIVVDVGDFFNYMFKYMPITEGLDFQSSVNYACMGTGVAGVTGSYIADPKRTHAVFVGDGGFYMNGMEILTAKEYNMPIIFFVINNSMLGLVKNGMKAIFNREFNSKVEFEKNSIASMANALNIDAVQITSLDEMDSLKELIENRTSPLVVEVITDGTEIFIDTDRLKKAK